MRIPLSIFVYFILFHLNLLAQTGDLILFTRFSLGSYDSDIYKMKGDGSNIELIYNDIGYCSDVEISSDYSKIIFSSDASSTTKKEIFIINSDGSGVQQITFNGDIYGSDNPRFFGASKIWYDRGPNDGIHEWWSMNYDGSEQVQLTNWQNTGWQSPYFYFNSDQTMVVYEKGYPSNAYSHEIFSSNVDLIDEIRLTNDFSVDTRPKLSHDNFNLKIVWIKDGFPYERNIFIMDINGINSVQLTYGGNPERYDLPIFSTDGNRIYYSFYDGIQWDIYYMNLDGTGNTNITNTSNFNEFVYDVKQIGVVPVELSSFSIKCTNNSAKLEWCTVTEKNNLGFEIERNSGKGFENIAFINGKGTTTEVNSYEYIDKDIINGFYEYRLKQIDQDGSYSYSKILSINIENQVGFELSQNYPNPFNPSTKISYQLPYTDNVKIKVYDVLGNEVITLVNEEKPAGKYELQFDGSQLSSGVYFYQIKSGNYFDTKKMILLK